MILFFFCLGFFFSFFKLQHAGLRTYAQKATSFNHRLNHYCLMMQNRLSVSIVNSYGILQWQNRSSLPNVSSSTPMKLI